MTLRIYNTLTRTKEVFTPIDPTNVRMYVCGPTVYDFAHIGNARPAIVFDVLYRLLRHLYGEQHVTYVRNITDVDDKINARALRDYPDTPLNEAIRQVTEKTYVQYQKDVTALGCLPPTAQPRATEHIEGMVKMISVLINNGHAYAAAGEVLFDVSSMKDYGALSGRKMEDQLAGARVAVDAHKKNPGDFVLWKQSSGDEPGWDSPWGRGRPGWHIECSVMSKAHLGEVFDIHGGGLDLIFPHHENEIAQSRCAHGTDLMANYWMHNGFLQVEGQKMSKSLGNFLTIQDVLNDARGVDARFAMLMAHYTQPIDWTQSKLSEARMSLQKFHRWYVPQRTTPETDPQSSGPATQVVDALCDDLNTPLAFKVLHELADDLGNRRAQENVALHNTSLSAFSRALDLLGIAPVQIKFDALRDAEISSLIAARLEARQAKDWKKSDEIRDQLAAMGIQIKDVKDPATGELKTEREAMMVQRDPSSGAARQLLPQGEKENFDVSTVPSPPAGEGARRADEGSLRVKQVFAKQLRRNMTDVEVKLWNALRGRRFENYKFRRQVRIGKYIADFVCFEKRLIIELDGSQHEESKHDEIRDAWLRAQNFRILRFWNIHINQALDGCLLAILDALK